MAIDVKDHKKEGFLEYKIGVKICILYFLIGSAWILFSDHAAAMLANNVEELMLISTYKGWAFILITTILLFFLIGYFLKQVLERNRQLYTAHCELEASYEETTAIEEELRQQFDELEKQTQALTLSDQKY
ncbi:MAG TPA: hypothetical protein VN611_17800, partial [Patescibacteria group bacterium]|nr:hypothetical protein [Patescibacteria group bacterium]